MRRKVSQEAWNEWLLFHNRERTELSNERTFLAWVRTSLALITLGFIVQRFDLLLAGAGSDAGVAAVSPLLSWVPVLFFALGGLIVVLGTWEFFRNRHKIDRGGLASNSRVRDALVVTTLIFLLIVSLLFIISKP